MQAKRTFAEATRSADFEERMLEYERKIEELSGDPFPQTPSEWMRLLVKAGFSDELINGFMASTEVEGFDECKPLPKGFVSVVSEESRPMFTARLVAGLERYQATTRDKSQGDRQARTKGRGRPSSHQKWERRYDEYLEGLEATPAKWVNPTQYAKTKFGASNDGSQARKKFKEIQLKRDLIRRK